ncbi:MAG: hypothetical protein OXH83_05095 [Bryobacterales bacterium]|nr:hypothetical protein [Bryobacterales bacterium]
MSPSQAILKAVAQSGRSDTSISIAATGHASAIKNLKRRKRLTVATAEALCRELGLEFYIGPPRVVPVEISKALALPAGCAMLDAVVEIARLAQTAAKR